MRRWLLPATLMALFSCIAVAQSPIVLEDVSERSGIDAEHYSGRSGQHFLIETVTSGLATLDYDGDGWIDIYLLSAAPLFDQKGTPPPRNRLYRNLGGMRFIDVTEESGTGDTGFGLGVTAGDFDNDGDSDLFVSNFGPNIMYVNNGDGTFTKQAFPEPSSTPRVGAGVALLDLDRDGNLDLFFATYVDFHFGQRSKRTLFGVPTAPGPKDYPPDRNQLFRNRGEGTFQDISLSSRIASFKGSGMGVIAFDFDRDRDTDIFVGNDSAPNFLFENQGDATFDEIAILAGVAYDLQGAQQGTMGVDVADFDGDGDIDLVTTNYMDEIPTLYRDSGKGFFDDVGPAVGLGRAARSVKWGVGFGDFDLDSWPDLFMATGHLIPEISRVNDSLSFASPNYVFRNLEGKRFVDVSSSIGSAGKAVDVSRGIVIEDLDNDGDVDIVVLNLDDQPQVIQNTTVQQNHFLQLQLIGTNCNRDGVGSMVRVTLGNRSFAFAVVSGRGYQSHFGTRLTIGLGVHEKIDSMRIDWHGGETQEWTNLKSDRRYLVIEGDPIVQEASTDRVKGD